MSDLDQNGTAFHGQDAPVLTYVTSDAVITIDPRATVRAAATVIVDQSIGMLVVSCTVAVSQRLTGAGRPAADSNAFTAKDQNE